jgi:hypothetical protein
MKIYLAARYSRHPEMRIVRAHLEGMGYEVTSRWINGGHEWINGGHELTKEGSTEGHEAERIRYAEEDVADLRAADIVISFTEEPRKTTTRGGRHVEFGMALALGKSVYVVGWRENVFHTLPTVRFFKTTRECLLALKKNPPGGDAVLSAPGPDIPKTIYKAVERVLDENSAWIARPNAEVTKRVALAAGIAWSLHTEKDRGDSTTTEAGASWPTDEDVERAREVLQASCPEYVEGDVCRDCDLVHGCRSVSRAALIAAGPPATPGQRGAPAGAAAGPARLTFAVPFFSQPKEHDHE